MPHSTLSDYPAFPDDVPVIDLPVISYEKLVDGDSVESKLLTETCKNPGCFLLDLRGVPAGDALLSERDQVDTLFKQWFDQDEAKKLEHPINRMTAAGYKPKGSTKADSKGNPDSNEFYTVTRLGVTSEPDPLMPTQVSDEKEMLASFMYHAHEVTIRVLTQVESFLHLAPGTLENLHAQDKASSSQTRVIKYHPQPDPDKTATFPSHTDLGSLTILFTHLGGLQVIPPNTEDIPANWKYVKPRDGCAIVNIGDTMTKYTNGLFTSPRHRVTYPPGEQASQYRYSIAYFARPDHQAPMQRLESDAIPPLKEGEVQDNLTVRKWYFNEFVRRQNIHDKL